MPWMKRGEEAHRDRDALIEREERERLEQDRVQSVQVEPEKVEVEGPEADKDRKDIEENDKPNFASLLDRMQAVVNGSRDLDIDQGTRATLLQLSRELTSNLEMGME